MFSSGFSEFLVSRFVVFGGKNVGESKGAHIVIMCIVFVSCGSYSFYGSVSYFKRSMEEFIIAVAAQKSWLRPSDEQ